MGKKLKGVIQNNSPFPCSFCHKTIEDEVDYGPFYTIGSISCHYFCVLLSTKLIQNGRDNDGVLGFLFRDIQRELKWASHKKCFYCKENGATIYCCQNNCRLLFHYPCGKANGALSLFYKTFQSFCSKHRKNQDIPESILSKRKVLVVKLQRLNLADSYAGSVLNELILNEQSRVARICYNAHPLAEKDHSDVCFICYESVIVTDNMNDIFWPPCCRTDALFHRKCLSRMAISAGKHFIRCPLCNNTTQFIDALNRFGIYIPIQDASWELESGAFNDLLHRPNECIADNCHCPKGRVYDGSESWKMIICNTCGSEAVHRKCINLENLTYECHRCIRNNDEDNVIHADVSFEENVNGIKVESSDEILAVRDSKDLLNSFASKSLGENIFVKLGPGINADNCFGNEESFIKAKEIDTLSSENNDSIRSAISNEETEDILQNQNEKSLNESFEKDTNSQKQSIDFTNQLFDNNTNIQKVVDGKTILMGDAALNEHVINSLIEMKKENICNTTSCTSSCDKSKSNSVEENKKSRDILQISNENADPMYSKRNVLASLPTGDDNNKLKISGSKNKKNDCNKSSDIKNIESESILKYFSPISNKSASSKISLSELKNNPILNTSLPSKLSRNGIKTNNKNKGSNSHIKPKLNNNNCSKYSIERYFCKDENKSETLSIKNISFKKGNESHLISCKIKQSDRNNMKEKSLNSFTDLDNIGVENTSKKSKFVKVKSIGHVRRSDRNYLKRRERRKSVAENRNDYEEIINKSNISVRKCVKNTRRKKNQAFDKHQNVSDSSKNDVFEDRKVMTKKSKKKIHCSIGSDESIDDEKKSQFDLLNGNLEENRKFCLKFMFKNTNRIENDMREVMKNVKSVIFRNKNVSLSITDEFNYQNNDPNKNKTTNKRTNRDIGDCSKYINLNRIKEFEMINEYTGSKRKKRRLSMI